MRRTSSTTSTTPSARASAASSTGEIAPHTEEWERAGIAPREAYAAAGRNGFLGMAIPEEHGGAGVDDFRFNVVIGEEVQLAGAGGFGLGMTLHNDICLPYFLEYCTDEQRERWLPGIASGELITAIAMTEPGTGSDLAGDRARAPPRRRRTTSSTAPRPSSPTASTPTS